MKVYVVFSVWKNKYNEEQWTLHSIHSTMKGAIHRAKVETQRCRQYGIGAKFEVREKQVYND